MFQIVNTLKHINLPRNVNLEFKRFGRKPRWLPTAKSKVFRVPVRPVIPEDEMNELKRLNNNYRTQMKSIRRYLVSKYITSAPKCENLEDQMQDFLNDFERCNKINEEWNAIAKVEKEQFFENQLEESVTKAKKFLRFKAEKKLLELEEAENLVREQKEASKTFITAENIEKAIEHALANPMDYNFAIDLDGNKHYNNKTNVK